MTGQRGSIEILPITGMTELRPGDDLVAEVVRCAPWLADDDILVVTSKIVSKVEGRLIAVGGLDEREREAVRQRAIEDETVRVVARRGTLQIVETHLGLVMAAAGVDASNVSKDEIALLPIDPDASARQLVGGLRERLGVRVGVVVSDTMGRPWRNGVADVAIGVAGITSVLDERGAIDKHGNVLSVTVVSLADELASAGDLVKGKLSDIPIAVVRGLQLGDDGLGSQPLVRGLTGDLFRLGTAEAIALGQAQAAGPTDVDLSALHADVLATLGDLDLDSGDGSGQASVREGFYGREVTNRPTPALMNDIASELGLARTTSTVSLVSHAGPAQVKGSSGT